MGTDRNDPVVWWLAGDDADDLIAALDERAAGLAAGGPGPAGPPAAVAATAAGPARLGLVDPDDRKVRLARRLLAKGEPWRGRSDIWFTPAGLADQGGKVAFLFPGVEPTFGAGAIDLPALADRLGVEAPRIADDTVAHQSASIYRLGIFLDLVLRRLGVEPDVVAGHSVGEWSGTVAAGMVPLERADELITGVELDAVDLPDLDFAALAAGAEAVGAVVRDIDGVHVSHDNSPTQSIICGPPAAVEVALARLREVNILGYTLPFQSGFHTPAIAPALESIRELAGDLPFGPGRVPMWSATVAGPYPETRDEIVDLHLRHLVEPVRFRPLVERLHRDAGARIFVQVGIGSLTGFVDDVLKDVDHASVPVLTAKRPALAQVHRALTALWVEGLDVRPEALRAEPSPPPARRPAPARDATPEAGQPRPAAPEAASASPRSAPAAARRGADRPGPGATPGNPTAVPAAAAAGADRTPPDPGATPGNPTAVPAAAAAGAAGSPARAPAGHAVAAPPAATAGTGAGNGSASLVAAADMLTAAARASQDVMDALLARLSPQTAPPPGSPAALAAVGAPATATAPPVAPSPPAAPAPATPTAPAAGGTPAAPPPGPGPDGGADWPTGKITLTRRLSLETMPETLDHTLYQQPEGWPDVADLFPIVAMTSQIQVIQDIAAEHAGGREVVEVFGIRNFRWLDLSEPVDVKVTIAPKDDGVLSVSLGGYCRANVRMGDYRPAPRYEPEPLTNERPTQHTAQDLWDRRLMFHGPRFQGINAMGPIGDDGMLGEFHHLDTPGSLLDNLGKLIAYWVIDRRGIGEGALPLGVERIEFFGPEPEPGLDVRCDIRILELQRDVVRADGVIILPDGTLWCRVEGWASIVFHFDELMEPLYHEPSRHQTVEPQPGGWTVLRERWPTGAGRDLTTRRFMCRSERQAYERMNLIEQRRYLLETVSVKDSVRHWLGERFGLESYPVQVVPVPDGERRFRVESPLVPEGHDPRITLSSLEMVADAIAVTVAIVGDGEYRDIEARQIPEGGDPEAVAREAAEIVAARNPGARVVSVAQPTHMVPSTLVDVPDPPPFAVAWTE